MDSQWIVTTTLPAVTLVLGALLTQWNNSRLDKAQLNREKTTRDAEREQARLDRREDFELNHLSDLHAALGDLAKAMATYSAHLEAERNEAPGSDNVFHEASLKLRSLKGPTLDDHVREIVETAYDTVLQRHLGEVGAMPTKTTPQALHEVGQAQYVVASRMRDIYKSDNLAPAPQLPPAAGAP
ncbi:hypothetical protein R6V09_12395 [Streptomyces sp. W16]|uniref:hypothetical protein n=1 Tax=Streptomyces sp. W16 TaxID=3076631 RepID=UPI00295A8EF5|nr:hypothetical protein [Streptomyces sp. W16]MDV9170931.1 hypothetical protein [Streptomyces sp. W16]